MARIETREGPKGKKFRVLIRMKGYAPVSATFTRKTDAQHWAQETESAMRSGRYQQTAARHKTLGEAIDRYIADVLPTKPKNANNVKYHLGWWKRHLGHVLLSQLSPPLLAEKRDLLLSETTDSGKIRSASTTVRYLASLSVVLSTAAREWMWVSDNPLKGVKKPQQPRGRVRFLDADEHERLLTACKESSNAFLYPAVVLSLSTGLRQGELYAITWPDINLERGFLTIHESKNGERRGIPIRGLALELLRELSAQNVDSFKVFPVGLRSAWDKAVARAGLNKFVWYSLRHSCASYLVMSGASITDVAEILGHKNIQITKRYSHLSDLHKSQVLDTMTKRFVG
jgi:integrase